MFCIPCPKFWCFKRFGVFSGLTSLFTRVFTKGSNYVSEEMFQLLNACKKTNNSLMLLQLLFL